MLTLAVVLWLGVFALGAQDSNYRQDENWKAPAKAAAKPNPIGGQTRFVAGGRKLFQRHCATCHGEQGEGLGKAADFRLPAVQQQSDGALFWKVTNGNPRRGMPSFSGLPEMQRWQLVLYLRTLALK